MSSGPVIIVERTPDIIPLITWLFTKQINNMTQNIDLNILLI